MNVQAYILSGIVESYVLGLASPEEQAEFERMVAEYPEVLQARLAFELALEEQAMAGAIEPPVALKEKIREAVLDGAAGVSPVVKLNETPVRQMNMWKYAAAASIVLLAGTLVWNFSLIGSNKELKTELAGANNRLADMNRKVDTMQQDLAVVSNPNMKMAVMKGLEAAPGAVATVYWDSTSHDVFLVAQNLPQPATDKQYQLWAIFKGKPVDLGVFDLKEEKLMIRAKNAQGAEAFAITLEQKGGSPVPKGPMYVLGKL